MPAPSRLTIITVKNQNFFFDFLKLYNELGKVKFFQVSIIWFRGCNSSFSLGGALNAPPMADRVNKDLGKVQPFHIHLLWLNLIPSPTFYQALETWYYPNSLVSSPGWVLVKCELRILSQFAFHLSPVLELPGSQESESVMLKLGVRDMLVKHHLFSWNS